MWFEKESGARRRTRRRSRNRRVGSTLSVSAKTRSRKSVKTSEFGRALAWPAGIILALALLWLGCMALGALLFTHNDHFTIKHLDIETDDVVALAYIREKQAIREGVNLFGFSARKVRREFLRAAPNYRSMDITRVLPDSLRISMTPREPIARIGRTGGFVVDRDRTVFGYRGDKSGLPTMLGYRGPMLTPGDRVTGQTADAILVIDVARSMDLGSELVIEGVDVRGRFRGRPDDMRIYLEGEIIVDLWWKRGQGESGEADLRARLEYLRGILRKTDQQRNRVKKVNLTLDSYETNTPVEYWH